MKVPAGMLKGGLDGKVPPPPDARRVLHGMFLRHWGMANIVMRPREGVPTPTLPELAWPEAAVAARRGAARAA